MDSVMPNDFLLHGESIDFAEDSTQTSVVATDAELTERYSAGAVRIVTEQARYPLPQIPQMVASTDYKLDPEFQRRHRWDNTKKSRLIESFIINVPVPPVFLYEVGYAKYEVMDGLQRLSAISDFYQSTLVLEGLEEWPELNGRTYNTLPEAVRRGVDRRYLSSVVLLGGGRMFGKNRRAAESPRLPRLAEFPPACDEESSERRGPPRFDPEAPFYRVGPRSSSQSCKPCQNQLPAKVRVL